MKPLQGHFPPLKAYPDQVHRVGMPPVAVTSQPNGSPSS